MKPIPENLITLLKQQVQLQDAPFLEGFCNCLSYQYPDTSLSYFYDNFDFVDSLIPFDEALAQFLGCDF